MESNGFPIEILRTALDLLKHGPKPLATLLNFAADLNGKKIVSPLSLLEARLTITEPNDPVLNILAFKLHEWDHEEGDEWTRGTAPHSVDRRRIIAELLELPAPFAAMLDTAIPAFTPEQRATVIALAHERWYAKRLTEINSFYWRAYVGQLAQPKGQWTQNAIDILNESTTDIVSRLSDPTRADIYQVKGLVVGYVQSGKTAHFSGVISKAADAGYRLVIVLAGTLNILRRQTQRRLDKDVVGQELLATEDYAEATDWTDFVSHGGLPSEKGAFDWERLTGLDDDYKALGSRIGALQFRRVNASKPFNDPINLLSSPARLLVIKKIPKIIKRLAKDLAALRKQGGPLDQIPTLIVDDESDQASVNTINTKKAGNAKKRTTTNAAIVGLLSALPRAQYVGYTATPFANVFVDPLDAEQLFPKDFIVSLPRPDNYMGVSDFFDFDGPKNSEGKGPNERAFVRYIEGEDSDDKNLPRAIDSYVLAGAIKLFRSAADKLKYRYKHHTMLVHHSVATVVHEAQASKVRSLFELERFTTARGRKRLEQLFISDFASSHSSAFPFPRDFDELVPFVGLCIAKIRKGEPVRIVNGDDANVEDAPDFEAGPVWAILIGGAKLSRGYTVEGLTTTYYRRVTNAADTLMQMGRWFGFRPGYTDLVRWYVGVKEQQGKTKGKTVDLYKHFEAICRDEEAFRAELTQYAQDDSIKPSQVPPLVHSHLPNLKPTSSSKMYNAELKFKNYSERWTEKTLISERDSKANKDAAKRLLKTIDLQHSSLAFTASDGSDVKFDAYFGVASVANALRFLRSFHWSSASNPIHFELEYLAGAHGDPCVDDCLVLLPQLKVGAIDWPDETLPQMTVSRRAITETGRFSIFSEPAHVKAASYIAATDRGAKSNAAIDALRNQRRAVLVMYRVKEKGNDDAPDLIGFGIKFPRSEIAKVVAWSARNASDDIVVDSRS